MYCFLLDFYVRNGFITKISFSFCPSQLFCSLGFYLLKTVVLSLSHSVFHICGVDEISDNRSMWGPMLYVR